MPGSSLTSWWAKSTWAHVRPRTSHGEGRELDRRTEILGQVPEDVVELGLLEEPLSRVCTLDARDVGSLDDLAGLHREREHSLQAGEFARDGPVGRARLLGCLMNSLIRSVVLPGS